MPGNAPHPFLDWPGPIAFAHRGDSSCAPENTMLAFERAVALGYRYVETDVHATRDGRLVAFHNSRLDGATDQTGLINELPWSQVRLARVGAREPIPTLEELLGTWPDLRVNIDPKDDVAADLLIDAIRKTNACDRVCVGSFQGRRLVRLRKALGDKLCTSLGPLDAIRLRAASLGAPLRRFPAPCAQVPVARGPVPVVDRRFIAAAHTRGIRVHVWTVNQREQMERLLDLGVDGIMTDAAATLRDCLTDRGWWF